MSYNLAQKISGNGETAVTFSDGIYNNTAMTLTNIHASDDVVVDLYIKDSTPTTFYILKDTTIPKGVTLVLQANEINFNNNTYTLYIKLNNADSAVDIITRYNRI